MPYSTGEITLFSSSYLYYIPLVNAFRVIPSKEGRVEAVYIYSFCAGGNTVYVT
jgi:hypothetical protein